MVVLDDRVLLNDISLMESHIIKQNTNYEHPSLDLFHDLSKYISKKDLEIHDSKIVSGGMYEDKIIGIPYEFDFDVMYYHKGEVNSKTYNDTQLLVDNMENYTWNELLDQMSRNSQPFRLSLADDTYLFYNETSLEFYPKFRDLVVSISYKNDARKTALTSIKELYDDFVKNATTFFKAKASHSIYFKNEFLNSEILLTLPPKYQTAITHNYIVANKHSDIDPEILAEVALVLTDKDAQLVRSEIFNSIPTFDFTKKDSDLYIQKYCNNHSVICDAIDKMKKLYVRDIFKSDYMIPFYEIMGYVPIKFKNYFIDPTDLELVRKSFVNMNEFITSHLEIYEVFSIIMVSITIIILIFFIFMTNKLKNHSYIKVISPQFCNLIVIGCILNLLKIFKFIPPYSSAKIKIFLILGTIGTSLIYIPMFAVVYRIYRIYKSKTFMSNTLSNKHLLIGVLMAVSISIIYNTVVVFTNRFYYITVGTINASRFPIILLLTMIIATGSRSKKFGDVCYTFVIFSTNISDFLTERLLMWLNEKNYPVYFFIISLYTCFVHFICVYFLVGSRIQLLMTNPNFDADVSSNGTSDDITKFIALRSKTMSILRRFSNSASLSIRNSILKSNCSQKKHEYTVTNSVKNSNPCFTAGSESILTEKASKFKIY
ncbi:hypothetical protein PIROE2DRAFT_10238 [Piromyces sp. E2]|nr:hypothetical protein PIROE2DRAFT_10238 [Piromyces sp. E2]|eukprot:OUM63269.1 hypothetical protein PIROE2DRAFT_10238 [Piromyces sp. E2]